MSFLPELNSKGEIVQKKIKGSKEKRRMTFDWSNLQAGRCPMCGNFLKPEGSLYICRGADHEKPFRIKERRIQELKSEMVYSQVIREQKAHLRSIK